MERGEHITGNQVMLPARPGHGEDFAGEILTPVFCLTLKREILFWSATLLRLQ
jgi:hypothetical protein